MKKITAVMGSPRKGETYKIVNLFEHKLKSIDDVNFEYIFLKDSHLGICRGCFLCLFKGEAFCPVKDDRDLILNRLMESDGVIFATPNYSLQVTAIMKNMLDRFAYIFHRPCFFHKTAMAIVTQGVYGDKKIIKYLEEVAWFWGFNIAPGLGITKIPDGSTPEELNDIEYKTENAARSFLKVLNSPQDPVPGIKRLALFRMTRTSHKYGTDNSKKDYIHFNEKGWFTSDYYYETRLGPFKKLLGALVDKFGAGLAKKPGIKCD